MNPQVYILLAGPIILILILTIVALIETRMVWPYGELRPERPYEEFLAYESRHALSAIECGFVFLGWTSDIKGGDYRLSYAWFGSPDRDCLAIIGTGTVMGTEVKGVWLHTPDADGQHSYYSTNHQSCVEIDVSGMWKSQLAPAAEFAALWRKHQEWTQRCSVIPRHFKAGRELADFKSVREEHFAQLAQRKLLSFINGSVTHWRYTVKGAFKLAFLNFSIGMLRAVTFGRIPRSA